MFLRLTLLFSVLVSIALYQRTGLLAEDTIIKTYFVTFFTFLVTTGFIFLYEKAQNINYFLASQVTYDILFTTVLTFYTGPYESMYTVFYLFNILFAAIFFSRLGALAASLGSAGLYLLISWLNSDQSGQDRTFTQLTTVTGFVSLALLSSQLMEELKKSRQKINRLEELSFEIVDSLDSGLIAIDGQGYVRKLNNMAQELLGVVNLNLILGKTLHEVFPSLGDIAKSEIKEVAVNGRTCRVLMTRVNLPDGQCMMLLKDLTEVLTLEEKVRRQERLAGVGRLATGVAHEIRNPIASISGAAQLLHSDSDDADERKRLTDLIVRESERVDRLVGQLLRFARPSQIKREKVDIEEVLRDCVEAIKARPDFRELDVDVRTDVVGPLILDCNRDELLEVVNNLLVNSLQAFLEQPKSAPKKLKVEAKKVQGKVRIVVADNGPGIPREYRGRIFDPFFTTKASGTGLGLAQVYKIVRDHDGQVDLETEEGKGTALTISLPA